MAKIRVVCSWDHPRSRGEGPAAAAEAVEARRVEGLVPESEGLMAIHVLLLHQLPAGMKTPKSPERPLSLLSCLRVKSKNY